MLEQVKQLLSDHLELILAIAGAISSVVFYFKGKEKKEFSYCLKSNSLILKKKNIFEKLSITYDGKQIGDLCVSKFTVWNSGNKTLLHSDMVKSKELTISTENGSEILDFDLIACSEETNNFSFEITDKSKAKLIFDYVDKNEGVVAQVIHTGTQDDLFIDCKIKGGKQIKSIDIDTPLRRVLLINEKFEKGLAKVVVIQLGLMILLLILTTLGLIVLQVPLFYDSFLYSFFAIFCSVEHAIMAESTTELTIAFTIILHISSILMIFVFIPLVKRTFNMGIPKSLKKYSDFFN